MKTCILHVFDEADTMAAHYVAMLTEATGNRAVMVSASNAKECKRLCDEFRPHILHMHGTPAFALPSGLRMVVTPHGCPLGPVKAFAIVARSPLEYDRLKEQFDRVEIVKNPLITRTITSETCAVQMLAIYQRVMDSCVFQLMNPETRHALAVSLAAAVYGDSRWVNEENVRTLKGTLNSEMSPVNFRQLFLYADHEGVLSLVQHGLFLLGISVPEYRPVSCYLPTGYSQPEPMTGAGFITLLKDIGTNGPSLLRLTELARMLHNDETLDEEALLRQADDNGLRTLLASVLQLLSEQLLLSEGFMPCLPADNAATQQLRQLLARRQDF